MKNETVKSITRHYYTKLIISLLLLMGGLSTSQNCQANEVSYQTEASWYSKEACKVNPDKRCLTADGSSLYDLEAKGVPYCANWHNRFGQRLKVTNLANGRSTECVVKDRGPNRRLVGRNLDLSRLAFERIGDLRDGVINVEVTEL